MKLNNLTTIFTVLIVALGLTAGCSALPPSRQYVDDIVQIERQVRSAELKRLTEGAKAGLAELQTELRKKADAAAAEIAAVRGEIAQVRTGVVNTSAAVQQLAERLTSSASELKGALTQQGEDIAQLQASASVMAEAIGGTKRAIADEAKTREAGLAAKADKTTVAKVAKTANAAAAKTTALTRRVSVSEDVAARGNVLVVQLMFPSGKADTVGNITAGTEVVPDTAKAAHDLIAGPVGSGEWYISEVVGFADARPFHGRSKAASDELNTKLSWERAWSVAEFLGDMLEDNTGAFEVSGAGTTIRYGSHAADRSVIVVMRRVQ